MFAVKFSQNLTPVIVEAYRLFFSCRVMLHNFITGEREILQAMPNVCTVKRLVGLPNALLACDVNGAVSL